MLRHGNATRPPFDAPHAPPPLSIPVHRSVPTILLTDPEQRAALAAARALAARGHRVLTVGASRGLTGVSRSVWSHVTVPAACVQQPVALREAVAHAVAAHAVDVVIPVSDVASGALLGYDDVVRARVAGPSADAYARASDKAHLLTVAASCGIRVPRQHALPQVDAPWPEGLAGSIVVKPSRSVVQIAGRATKLGVRFAASVTEARHIVADLPSEAYPLLLQERTLGDGIGVFLLRAARVTRLVFAHRRLREKPPAGGVSTYREAIAVPSSLQAACERLLDALDYEGAAMLEFKEERETGEVVLMEINARLWGSLQLAIDAGVDFPQALVALALGEPVPTLPAPRLGVRTVWELGELDHALALARRGRAARDLPPEVPVGWGAAVRALMDHRWRDRPEVFRWSDPKPFLFEAWRWLRRV
jgi:predicted ATP-grasp superfamily ATP-dependent carboligase